ncbi:MAG: FecR domain-containing protein [Verrucomicrobiota bacterium]|jgi:hypothetical protein
MKRIKSILICGLVLALTGVASLVVAAGGDWNTKAIVRAIHGKVSYKAGGGDWMPLKVNQELSPGTQLKTDPGSEAYLQVNGFASTVKLTENTTVTLSKMMQMGSFFSPDSSTDLKLDGGKVLGSVRKLSANSDYKVTVPNGVAGIRGTDFEVTVTVESNGALSITFTSVTGTVFCQVTVAPGTPGQSSQTLTTGQSWTVTGTVANGITTLNSPITMPAAALGAIVLSVEQMQGIVNTAITISTTTPTTVITTIVPPNNSASQVGGSTPASSPVSPGEDGGTGSSSLTAPVVH